MAKYTPPKDPRGPHLRIYADTLDSPAFRALSPHDVLAFLALLRELKSYNNGDLSLPVSRARLYGIKSHVTLAQCLRALRAVGLIAITRKGGSTKGGQRLATLYRFTDRECYEIRDKTEAMPVTDEWRKVKTVDQGKKLIADFEKDNRRSPKLESLRHPLTGTPTADDVISALTPTFGDIDDESISQAVTYGKSGENSMMAQV